MGSFTMIGNEDRGRNRAREVEALRLMDIPRVNFPVIGTIGHAGEPNIA
jgi:hypothetical protein